MRTEETTLYLPDDVEVTATYEYDGASFRLVDASIYCGSGWKDLVLDRFLIFVRPENKDSLENVTIPLREYLQRQLDNKADELSEDWNNNDPN